jgi:DNA-binding CsgD family transcriptional regulator
LNDLQVDLVDRIYEAAVVPELWAELLHDISVEHEFVGGVMFTLSAQDRRAVGSKGVEEVFEVFLRDGWASRSSRAERTVEKNHPGFVRDQDLFTEEEIERDPMYRELLEPFGLGWVAGSVINCPNGDHVALSFERAKALGPTPLGTLATFDGFRPHLARAAMVSARLDRERSLAKVSALSAIGLPAAVLTADGRALAVNEELAALAPQLTIGARDVVRFGDAGATALLAETLAMKRDAAVGRSFPVKGARGAAPAVIHVLPVRRAAQDVFSMATWLLAATPLGRQAPPDATILAGLFDLTPAEARIARELVAGRTLTEIATAHGVADSTVRNQLRAVFHKTGATRQAELVLMCGGTRRLTTGVPPRVSA